MTIETDISVAANGDIRYTGSTANFTVIEFHRFLQDLADDAVASGDDLLDITNDTPSERSTDNIITLNSPFNIDDTLAEHIYDGSIAQAAGAIVYAGLVVVGSVPVGTNLQLVQNNTILTNYWGVGINANAAANILLRIMVKVRDAGADIDGRRLRVQARELGDTYGEFSLSTALGNNTAAIFTAVDLNNPTIAGTIAGWTSIVNGEGYQGLDVSGDGSVEFYYSKWELGIQGINDLYERTKWITRRGTAETIHGLNGELFRGITHEVSYDGQDASEFFSEDEVVTFGNGATAIILGDSEAGVDSGVTGKMYVQLLTGTAPSDNDTIAGLSCNALVVGSPVTRTVKPEFIGASTGSAIIGNYGIGIDPTDLTASDQLFDLTNSLIVPPNNVSFTVSGLVSGEDRILVGPENAGSILVAQLSISGTLAGGEATVVVNEAIPSDTPSTGTIRILKDDGVYERVTYTGFSASSFTGCANVPAASAATNCFISYIDTLAGSTQESFTTVYNASRSLFIRVRDGGATPIKTFETTGNLGSAGGSSTAIRSSDA
jgi:hypothetical protein